MSDSIEKAASRLRFDHLNGETAWRRLMVWVRRHMFLHILCVIAFLLVCIAFSWVILIKDGELASHLFDAVLITVMIPLIFSGVLSFWLFFLMERIMRRKLRPLGDPEFFAGELEADLAESNPIRFYRRGVYITKRYLAVETPFAFRLYPLQGLSCCKGVKTTVLCYENGRRFKLTAPITIDELKSFLAPEDETLPKAEPEKPVKKRAIVLNIAFYVILILLLTSFALAAKSDGEWNFVIVVPLVIFCIIAALFVIWVAYIAWTFIKSQKIAKVLENITDPTERLQKLEELRTAKAIDTLEYLNRKSIIYSELGDYEQALQYIREAYLHMSKNQKTIRIGKRSMGYHGVFRYNEAVFQTNLQRYAEATVILDELEAHGYTDVNTLFLLWTQRARLSLAQNEMEPARDYLSRVKPLCSRVLSAQRTECTYQYMLLEAHCDILEQNTDAALRKIDEVLEHTAWPFTVKRAKELKMILAESLGKSS